jgi:hypothetical protein
VAPLVPVIGGDVRRRTLLVVLAGLAVVAAGAVVLWPREDRVTRANFGRIRTGMSRAEVEAILGPPGDYRTGHGETAYGYMGTGWLPDPPPGLADALAWNIFPGQSPEDARRWANWLGDSFIISIVIDESEQVKLKQIDPRRRTQGPLDNLLWRFKRQWHRWFP